MTRDQFAAIVALLERRWPWRPDEEPARLAWLDRLWHYVGGWEGPQFDALADAVDRTLGDDGFARPSVQALYRRAFDLARERTAASSAGARDIRGDPMPCLEPVPEHQQLAQRIRAWREKHFGVAACEEVDRRRDRERNAIASPPRGMDSPEAVRSTEPVECEERAAIQR